MSRQTGYFIVGLIIIVVVAEYAPRLAGMFLILLLAYLGFRLSSQLGGTI